MNEPKFPPLPDLPPPEVEEWSESFITFRGEGWKRETVEKYAQDYARAAIEANTSAVPDGLRALLERRSADSYSCGLLAKDALAMLAAAPQPQPVAQPDDSAESVNETNAVLASRYFELLKVVEAYEAHGVTCQTFRHFVAAPCAECNSVAQPVQSQPSEIVEAVQPNPTNNYLFKLMCYRAGIVLGVDRVDSACEKIDRMFAQPVAQPVQASGYGHKLMPQVSGFDTLPDDYETGDY